MKKYLLIALVSGLLVTCSKEKDLGLIKGDVTGRITLVNQYGYDETDGIGTTITIKNETINQSTSTDAQGFYKFEDLPFGTYNIQLSHEGYMRIRIPVLTHIGGNTPTINNSYMNQIPTFTLQLDSLVKDTIEHYAIIGKIPDIAQKPKYGFPFTCFLSNKADVSKDNYIDRTNLYGLLTTQQNIKILFPYFQGYLNTGKYDTVFIRVYPLVQYQYYYMNSDPYLGLPSNILKYVVVK